MAPGIALLIDYVVVALVVVVSFTLAFVIDYAPVSVPLFVLGFLSWGLGPFVYTTYLHATRGQTVGKRNQAWHDKYAKSIVVRV